MARKSNIRLKSLAIKGKAVRLPIHICALLVAATLPATACGQSPHGPAGHAAPAAAPQGRTVDIQGDPQGFMNNRHVRAFYALSVETLGKGAQGVDVAAYEQKSYAIFRELGPHMGTTPEAMQDHLKLIPRQVVKIVQDDPHVLDSFEAFSDALVGPK